MRCQNKDCKEENSKATTYYRSQQFCSRCYNKQKVDDRLKRFEEKKLNKNLLIMDEQSEKERNVAGGWLKIKI